MCVELVCCMALVGLLLLICVALVGGFGVYSLCLAFYLFAFGCIYFGTLFVVCFDYFCEFLVG